MYVNNEFGNPWEYFQPIECNWFCREYVIFNSKYFQSFKMKRKIGISMWNIKILHNLISEYDFRLEKYNK